MDVEWCIAECMAQQRHQLDRGFSDFMDATAAHLRKVSLLRKALVGLIGSEAPNELSQMLIAIESLPASEADKAVTINAIRALIQTSN